MNDIIQIVVTVVCSVLASQGLWAFLSKHADQKDAKCNMLIGLAEIGLLEMSTKISTNISINHTKRWAAMDRLSELWQRLIQSSK